MRHKGEVEAWLHSFYARCRNGVGDQSHSAAALAVGKGALQRMLGEPHGFFERVWGTELSPDPSKVRSRTLQPIASATKCTKSAFFWDVM